MPLVTTKEMFKKAYDGGYAIGAFNVNNMEIITTVTIVLTLVSISNFIMHFAINITTAMYAIVFKYSNISFAPLYRFILAKSIQEGKT